LREVAKEPSTLPITQQLLAYMSEREELMQSYLQLMDLIQRDIAGKNTPALEEHSRVEESLVQRIEALQKVISSIIHEFSPDDPTVRQTEEHFRLLCAQALGKNRENRQNLQREMGSVRKDLDRLRRLRARTGKTFSEPHTRYIDVEG